MNKLRKELDSLREKYISIEQMADALRVYPGFENIDRTTVWRWFKKPTKRTAAAIRVLKSKGEVAANLRIAEIESFWTLPSLMLSWAPEEGKPYGLLKKEWNVELKRESIGSFTKACERVYHDETDIALAPRTSLRTGPQFLCSIGRANVMCITRKKIQSTWDLAGIRFAAPPDLFFYSALRDTLDKGLFIVKPEDEKDSKRWELIAEKRPLFLSDAEGPESCARQMKTKEIDGVIAWEPFLSMSKREAEKLGVRVFPAPPGTLGTVVVGLYVSHKAGPRALRAYLWSLQKTIDYLNTKKSQEPFQAEIASRFGIDRKDVERTFSSIDWKLSDLNGNMILQFWEREVSQKG